MLRKLESLEITIHEKSAPKRKFGPFSDLSMPYKDLPHDDESSWQVVVKANGGYGRNHDTGLTSITNWVGELRDVYRFIEVGLAGYSTMETP